MKITRTIGIALTVLLATTLIGTVPPADRADAANASLFDAGNIISDSVFFNGESMSKDAVQSFLNASVAMCQSGFTCLKDYQQDTPNLAAVAGRCDAYSGRSGESASSIIARVGEACGISQKAILVLLEKEQGIVTSTAPSSTKYRSATGYGCPDTALCDSKYYGLFNQIYNAALQFQRYAGNPTGWNHVAGRVNAIRYNPNSACGSSSVYIQNQATAGLYNYTPYQPNTAAVSNLYGSGDACSAYGNRNFWRIFSDWFGSPTSATSLLRTNGNGTVYLVSGTYKHPVASMSVLTALAPLGTVGYVSDAYLAKFVVSAPVGRAIRGEDGTIYFYDSGIKLPFVSCAQAVDYGASCAASGYVQLTAAQVGKFHTGPALGPVLGTTSGNRYSIKDGHKAEILDDKSRALAGLPSGMNVLSESSVETLPLTNPIVRDATFARSKSSGTSYLLSGGKRYTISKGDDSALGVADRTAGTLSSASLLLIPSSPATFSGIVRAEGTGTTMLLSASGRYDLSANVVSPNVTPAAVAQSLVDSYSANGAIGAGSFIKGGSAADVYVVMPTNVRPISGWGALLALSADGKPIIRTVASGAVASLVQGPVALTAGTLVRSPEDATVFFIDGVSSRVPFSSFQFPREAGFDELVFSTTERIQGYPLAKTNLTFGLSCGADKYVAAGGQVHYVASEFGSLYPFDYVAMDQFTCAQFDKGSGATSFIRTPDGSIYQLVGGQKRPITSIVRLRELTATDSWLNVVDAFASLIPTGAAA